MKKQYFILLSLFAVILIIMFIDYRFSNKTSFCRNGINEISIDNKKIHVLVADDEEERQLGLSNHKILEPNEGMLFVFQSDTKPSFWMKDMLFPINIFWIDRNNIIIGVTSNVSPDTYPLTFSPDRPIRFVLETSVLSDQNPDELVGKEVKLICK